MQTRQMDTGPKNAENNAVKTASGHRALPSHVGAARFCHPGPATARSHRAAMLDRLMEAAMLGL